MPPKESPADEKLNRDVATGSFAADSDIHASPVLPVLCYCFASILMTLVNKFVVSGAQFSMTFLLLAIQSSVCSICVLLVKRMGIISFRAFDSKDAKAWFPISFMLVFVIYTGSKSLQYLSIPVYTIFKNLTIILIAYGEMIWFGGKVSALTFVSFVFMVVSSVIAAWSDISAVTSTASVTYGMNLQGLSAMSNAVYKLNIGYLWMLINCLTSAAYVLTMRKRIKVTGFTDWDSMFYSNALGVPVLAVFSFIAEDWGAENLKRNFPEETRNFLLMMIVFSGTAAVGISYTTAWCIRVTSSTTYSMVGALNKLPVAASGMMFFGDPVTLGSVSAIGVGFFAGLLYAVAKNNQKATEAHSKAQPIIPLNNRSS
ncbi:GDP-mannose transporter [Cylindrobasidium torrendii FP15055 ss-10]|uniref:GDP-mannose transporter n=1 Tax=Cylindrobasidium torrendii FP15055 ss-10 TaxID=1314674 RepID=A0A0D7BJU9_9AGAR|nr:GDP-mannose transporter [Cylindrobasidium torrendii FP15055 ss-10]